MRCVWHKLSSFITGKGFSDTLKMSLINNRWRSNSAVFLPWLLLILLHPVTETFVIVVVEDGLLSSLTAALYLELCSRFCKVKFFSPNSLFAWCRTKDYSKCRSSCACWAFQLQCSTSLCLQAWWGHINHCAVTVETMVQLCAQTKAGFSVGVHPFPPKINYNRLQTHLSKFCF